MFLPYSNVLKDADGMANSVDSDQSAPILFAWPFLSKNLGTLLYEVSAQMAVFKPLWLRMLALYHKTKQCFKVIKEDAKVYFCSTPKGCYPLEYCPVCQISSL